MLSLETMSLTRNSAISHAQSSMKPGLQISQWVPPGSHDEAALQLLLMQRCSRLAACVSGDTANLDRFKALLRLLISEEDNHRGSGWTVEGPSRASVAAAAARRVDLRRYKTELCRSFAETGQCRYGPKCQFAHGADELRPLARHPRYRTELCHSFHVNGFCPYGSRCNFIHSDVSTPPGAVESPATCLPACRPAIPGVAMVSNSVPHLQGSAVDSAVLHQWLGQSADVKQRAICGRTAPSEMSAMTLLHAIGSVGMNATQERKWCQP